MPESCGEIPGKRGLFSTGYDKYVERSVALQNEIDVKTVSSMLGHSSAGFTLATYTHVTNKVQEQAAAKMGSLLKQAL